MGLALKAKYLFYFVIPQKSCMSSELESPDFFDLSFWFAWPWDTDYFFVLVLDDPTTSTTDESEIISTMIFFSPELYRRMFVRMREMEESLSSAMERTLERIFF